MITNLKPRALKEMERERTLHVFVFMCITRHPNKATGTVRGQTTLAGGSARGQNMYQKVYHSHAANNREQHPQTAARLTTLTSRTRQGHRLRHLDGVQEDSEGRRVPVLSVVLGTLFKLPLQGGRYGGVHELDELYRGRRQVPRLRGLLGLGLDESDRGTDNAYHEEGAQDGEHAVEGLGRYFGRGRAGGTATGARRARSGGGVWLVGADAGQGVEGSHLEDPQMHAGGQERSPLARCSAL